jgi:hypothetical protein
VDDLDGEAQEEFQVESVLAARGQRGRRQVLVKWEGYVQPTWEPLDNFQETAALEAFERQFGNALLYNGPGDPRATLPRPRRGRRGG